MKKFVKVFAAIMLTITIICAAGCKKDDNGGIPIPSNEDLSYLIVTYSREETNDLFDNEDVIYETLNTYDGYKITSHKLYRNGQLFSEGLNYAYDGLNCNYDFYSYSWNNINGMSNEVDIWQHIKNEYLDETYLRLKHGVSEYEYGDNSTQEDKVYEYFHEYEGKKQVGFKSFLNGILGREIVDYNYNGLNCSYTMKTYSNTGNLVYIGKYEVQYLDDTYLRQKAIKYTTEYVDGSPTTVYYKIVQYDGKKQVGYKVFDDGILTEEGKDYAYDGLKCYYKVDYYRNGELSHTSSFEVHYLE